MKNTLKAISIVLAPSFITLAIFNVKVLKTYAQAKTMEDAAKIKRSPAVITKALR